MIAAKILVVDDTPSNVKLLADVLGAKGYAVVTAASGADALEVVERERPALILMDIHLPGIDGIEALRRLRADAGTRDIPVLAVTASAMTHDRQKILAAGFDGYQTKPINLREFLAAVDAAVGGRR